MWSRLEWKPIIAALSRNKTAPILVALQIAISLAILINALYIVQLRVQKASRPSGVADESGYFTVRMGGVTRGGHEQQLALQRQITDKLKALPNVSSAVWVSQSPLSQSGNTSSLYATRKAERDSGVGTSVYMSPDSLVKHWGLKLIQGRDFNDSDVIERNVSVEAENSTSSIQVAVISKTLAEKLYPGQTEFVGKSIYWGSGPDAAELKVIGVVERLQSHGADLGTAGETSVILPYRLSNFPYAIFQVQSKPGFRDATMQLATQELRVLNGMSFDVATETMENDRKERYRADMALAWMLIAVSALLVLVTLSGIVGMSSLWVTQRRKQIGIRRALGAQRSDILRYFLTENFLISCSGALLGLILAIALNQALIQQFELSKIPLHYLPVALLIFIALGLVAAFVPAYRAAQLSPAIATRSV